MTGYLLDTHIWFWFLLGSSRLPRGLRNAIDRSPDECSLSPVSIWELCLLARRGRIRIGTDVGQWLGDALDRFPVTDAPLNREVAKVACSLRLPHRDPADHFLAATALVYELTLFTVDERLTDVDWLPTRRR